MREIKFRAWNKGICRMFSSEEMGEDELTINPDGRGFVNVNGSSQKLSQYYPHMIPMQYTGLKDVDGKDIYEGDILVGMPCFGEKTQITRVIKWDDDIEQSCGSGFAIGFDMGELEYNTAKVVGNIYENKELLDGI